MIGLHLGGPIGALAGAVAGGVLGTIGGEALAQGITDAIGGALGALSDAIGDALGNAGWLGDALSALGAAMGLSADPLVIDLDGDGVELLSIEDGVHFDLNADNFAERTGWVAADDGLLSIDRNADGIINNITELFGDNAAPNGFAALSEFDSNKDGKIDALDVHFSEIKVWQDSNSNGKSEATELRSLNEVGISIINLSSTAINQTVNGNLIVRTGSYETPANGSGIIAEAIFRQNPSETIYVGPYTIAGDALTLPMLRGYGLLPDLRVAMSMDASLLEQVKMLSMAATNPSTYQAQIEQILFKWAGVDTVEPDSRGAFVDARHLAFLEKLLNVSFFQASASTSNPRWNAAVAIEAQWSAVLTELSARLLVQGPLSNLFPDVQYNLLQDQLTGTFDLTALDALAEVAGGFEQTSDVLQFWVGLVPVLDLLASNFNADAGYEAALSAAIAASGLTYTASELRDDGFGQVIGTSGNDQLVGTAGANLLDGGTGNDVLKGGAGSDAYVFDRGYGEDLIDETDKSIVQHGTKGDYGKSDIVLLGNNLIIQDLQWTRGGTNSDDLIIKVKDSADKLTIKGYFTTNGLVEEIRFNADGSLLSYDQVMAALLTGTSGNDNMYGDAGDNRLDGAGGNDYLEGRAGGDTYVFGLGYGTDRVYDDGGGGFDVLEFDASVSTDNVRVTRGANRDELVFTLVSTGESITIEEYFDGTTHRMEGVKFADGTSWNYDEILQRSLISTSNNDVLIGDSGDNRLDGGAGNDSLDGGEGGGDTYVFSRGYGADKIYDQGGGGTDILELKSDVAVADIKVSRGADIDDLVLRISDTDDSVTIDEYFNGTIHRVEQIKFADGTVWDYDDIMSMLLIGTENADTLIGNSAANYLDGGAGNDILQGGAGGDTYVFGKGYGVDKIYDAGGGGTDALEFIGDLTPNDIVATFGSDPDDLVLTIASTGEYIWIDEYFDGTTRRIDEFRFADGTTWGHNEVWTALFLPTNADQRMYGDSADNRLDGGAGNDIMEGGAGGDTYVFGRGYGQDQIYDAGGGGTDTLEFKGDILPADIWMSRANGTDDLVLSVMSAGDRIVIDRIVINDYFSGTTHRVEEFRFANGVVWTSADIASRFITGTTGNDTLVGSEFSDVIDGGSGVDVMSGKGGNDTYVVNTLSDQVVELAGEGNDTIRSSISWTLGSNVENLTLTGSSSISGTGNELDNTIFGNTGANTLIGGAGNDYLDGNTGNDKMSGGIGDDTYVIQATGDVVTEFSGEGTDTILSSISVTSLTANVENLTLTGAVALNGTGNSLNNSLQGNSGANVLTGGDGDDTLAGGGGNDTLIGGQGSDTYRFRRGDGSDVIQGSASDLSADTLSFGPNVAYDQIWFMRSGDDLIAQIIGSNDIATISGWYGVTSSRLDRVQLSNGSFASATDVDQLVSAMSAFDPPGISETGISGDIRSSLQPVLAASWQQAA